MVGPAPVFVIVIFLDVDGDRRYLPRNRTPCVVSRANTLLLANLICFPAKPLRSPLGFEAQADVLYDLVSPVRLDALVIWLAGMTLFVNGAGACRVCERYGPPENLMAIWETVQECGRYR
jgi:hypothetical protein